MTLEEIRGSLGCENGNDDRFSVGMRVLAVDDDPTCFMLLDGLLRKCQYQAMAMISRLQAEKTAIQMEALQYQRMMEKQVEYDQEAIQVMKDLFIKREDEVKDLEAELETYREKYGLLRKISSEECVFDAEDY